MIRKAFLLIALLLHASFLLYADEIEFVKRDQYVLMNQDQQYFMDAVIHDDYAYLLMGIIRAHQFYKGVSFQQLYLPGLAKNSTEYFADTEHFQSVKYLLGMDYQRDMWSLPVEQELLGQIFIDDDTIYLPDNEGYSYQFTNDGESLGRIPDFEEPDGIPEIHFENAPETLYSWSYYHNGRYYTLENDSYSLLLLVAYEVVGYEVPSCVSGDWEIHG